MFLACSKFPESVQLVRLALLTIRVVQKRKCLYRNPRHVCITFYQNNTVITWFVCLCILVLFGVYPFLSEPCKWFKNEKARLSVNKEQSPHYITETMIEIPHMICLEATSRPLSEYA